MLDPGEFREIGGLCKAFASRAAEPDGFVPIRNLLQLFQAKLIVRPMLVEAMIAQSTTDKSWNVLLDQERCAFTSGDLEAESSSTPLPDRARFSIAHELAHTLAFRTEELSIRLAKWRSGKSGRETLVRDIESATDKLSPLLLIPDGHLRDWVRDPGEGFSIPGIVALRKRCAISRYVLINRLRLFFADAGEDLRYRSQLANTALMIFRWNSAGIAELQGWPIFKNFLGNIVPRTILDLSDGNATCAARVIPDTSFALCGGSNETAQFITKGGTAQFPDAEACSLSLHAEPTGRRPGSTGFLLIRRNS